MTYTATELAEQILGELGDTENTIWSDLLMLDYIEKALYDFKMRTLCSWKRSPLNNIVGQATYPIPDSYNFHQLDRAEEDYWAVTAVPPRVRMAIDGNFETSGNRPLSLLAEGDGVGTIRKIGVPTSSVGSTSDYALCTSGTQAVNPSPGQAWTNPEYITQDDLNYAATPGTPLSLSDYLIASDFHLDALDGEVQGITVAIGVVTTGSGSMTVELIRGGVSIAAKGFTMPTTYAEELVVFTTADWTGALLGEEINESTFSVRVFSRSHSGQPTVVGYIKVAYVTSKFIIEYFACGEAVSATPDEVIDLPQRYMTYVAYKVKAEAYTKDGDGQSLKLAAYWESRYEDAITMMERRRERLFRRRISNIGHDGRVPDGSKRRDPGTLPAYYPKID